MHGWPLHRLGNRFSIAIVVLMPLQERLHILCRDEPHVVVAAAERAAREESKPEIAQTLGNVRETPCRRSTSGREVTAAAGLLSYDRVDIRHRRGGSCLGGRAWAL
jgi:hypothetical protein